MAKETYTIVCARWNWSDHIGPQPLVVCADHQSLQTWHKGHVDLCTLYRYMKTVSDPGRERIRMVLQTTKLNRCGMQRKHHGMKKKERGVRGMTATRRPPHPPSSYAVHTLSIGETHKV